MPEINYRITCPSGNVQRSTRYAPVGGIINSAIVHFPAGCQCYVEVQVFHKTNMILPSPNVGGSSTVQGLALDDTTQSFDISHPVPRGDPIEVVITNHDGASAHTISVVILISSTKEYTGP